jgi:zinc protease
MRHATISVCENVKRILLSILIIAIAAIPLGARTQEIGGPGDGGIFQTTLKNGLHVVVVEDHAAPVIQTATWYHFGSLDETKGKTGLAHALEHMMYRGTVNISAGGLDDIVARLGAQMNGQTSYDYTQFYFVMPADKLDVGLYIEADRMANASISQAGWNVEGGAVMNELLGDEGSPFFNLLTKVREAAYPGEPNGRTPIGFKPDVQHATAADIARYYHEWYGPNNATVVVAGDVRHETVFARVSHFFGAIPPKKLPARNTMSPVPIGHTTEVESNLPFPFEMLDLAYAVPGDTEPGEPAVNALVMLINNQLSPFYQSLVQTNVALAVEASQDTQLRGGLLNVFIVLSPGHSAREAQTIFQSTMDTLIANGFSSQLVQTAKRLAIAERMYSGDSVTGIGDLAGYTYGLVGERINDEDTRLAALDEKSILAIASAYFKQPTVVGHLRTKTNSTSGSQKSDATASDDFSKRVPDGPIVEPQWVRVAVQKPTTARSSLSPVEFTLSNGIKVAVSEKHDRATFTLRGEILGGSSFIPRGKEGIARLASSLADFGSDSYPFMQRRRAIDAMGAVVSNGGLFVARGTSRDFASIVKILADGELHPSFAEPWLSLERGQLASSLQQEDAISSTVIDRAYFGLLSASDDPSLRHANNASVSGISRDDLVDFTKRYWRPDLTSIAVVGDVTPAQVRATLEAEFRAWNGANGATPDSRERTFPQAHGGHYYVQTDATQLYVRLGQPMLARSSPDYPAMQVLNQILGAGGAFESRLWQELRQKRGLVYSATSSLNVGRDRGDLRIELNASPSRIPEAVRFVRSELKRFQHEPVTETELAEAKLRLVSDALLDEASADGQVQQVLDIAVNGLPADYYRALNERFAAITPAEIERVAQKYLAPDNLVQVYAGPRNGPWVDGSL